MARTYLTPINLGGLELQNAVVQNLATGSLPASPAGGRIAYDSTTNQFKVGISSGWHAIYTDLTRLDQITAPTASVSLNSQKITNLLDPSNPQDAATKNYVDSNSGGSLNNLDWKASVRVASISNITVASPGATIDGVTMANGDRVLLANQSLASENGLYVYNGSASAMTRATDASDSTKLTLGAKVYVDAGTNQSGIFTFASGTFASQTWQGDVVLGRNATGSSSVKLAGGGPIFALASTDAIIQSPSSTYYIDVSDNGIAINQTPVASAGALQFAAATTVAGGIKFGETNLYRSAANTLLIGNTGASTVLNIDPVTATGTATLGLISRSAGTATTITIAGSVSGALSFNFPSTNGGANFLNASQLTIQPNGTSQTSTLNLTSRDSGGAALLSTIVSDASGNVAITPGGTNGSVALAPAGTGTTTAGSKRITNVADPTGAQDAATKNYVDNAVQGLDAKASVRAATTSALTFTIAGGAVTQINGTTVDGVSPAINDRILIKDAPAATGAGSANSNQPANGIYVVTGNTTNLTVARASDMDTWAEVPNAYVWVESGSGSNADTAWVVTSDQGGTLNTTGIQWVKFATSASNSYFTTLGTGTGTTISVPQSTHNLRQSRGIVAQIQDDTTGNVVDADVSVATNGDVTVTFAASQTLTNFRVTLIG